jgi:hypothetical protein
MTAQSNYLSPVQEDGSNRLTPMNATLPPPVTSGTRRRASTSAKDLKRTNTAMTGHAENGEHHEYDSNIIDMLDVIGQDPPRE